MKVKAYQSCTIDIATIDGRHYFENHPLVKGHPDHDVRVCITRDFCIEGRKSNQVGFFTCQKKFIDSELQSRGYMTAGEVKQVAEQMSKES
jgi:hypothetical protein